MGKNKRREREREKRERESDGRVIVEGRGRWGVR